MNPINPDSGSKGKKSMKREQLILQSLSDKQLVHAKRILDREVTRRSSAPPARRSSAATKPRARKAA